MQYILDTVVSSLAADSSRRFTWSEQGFFQRWWHEQDDSTQTLVRKLVSEGQLAFVGGGWTQHDEGCTTYVTVYNGCSFTICIARDLF